MTTPLAAPRLRLPRSARPGEAVEIRTLVEHPMETGLRQDGTRTPPRDMLERLVLRVNGEVAFQAELRNGTSTNPFHVLYLRLERTSEIEATITDDRGRTARSSGQIVVG